MKRYLIFSFLNFLIVCTCYAQSNIEIIGYVLDRDTDKPLEAVNIYLENSNYGTITNEDGEFKFIVPNNSGQLVFSYLGYVSKTFDLKDIDTSKLLEVNLVPHDEILEEILLSSVPVSDLLENILENSKNRAKESILLTTYNREILKTDDEYCFFADGIIDYHIEGNGKKIKSKMDLKSTRIIDGKCDSMNKFLKGNPFSYKVYDLAEKPFEKNIKLNHVLKLKHNYKFTLKTKFSFEKSQINMIEFKPLNDNKNGLKYEGYVLYDVATNLILEFYLKKASNEDADAFGVKSFILTFSAIDTEVHYSYRLVNNKYTLVFAKEYDKYYIRNLLATTYNKTFSFYRDLTTLNYKIESSDFKFKPYKDDFMYLNGNSFSESFWENTSISESSEEKKFKQYMQQ